jgi:valyl-tRNA synthetase
LAHASRPTLRALHPYDAVHHRGALAARPEARERLTRDLGRTQKDLAQLEAKLKNAGFVERAPKELVEAERAKLAELQEKRSQFEKALAKLS